MRNKIRGSVETQIEHCMQTILDDTDTDLHLSEQRS